MVSEERDSAIEAAMDAEFSGEDVPQGEKIEPGNGVLGAATVEAPDPVHPDILAARRIFRVLDEQIAKTDDSPYRTGRRRLLHRGRMHMDRVIEEIRSGKVLTGPLVRRRPQ